MIWVSAERGYVRPQKKNHSFISTLFTLHKFSESIGVRHKDYVSVGPTFLVEWVDD